MSYQYPPSPTFGLPLSPKSFSVLPENPRAPLYDPHSNPPTTPKQTLTRSAPGLTVTPPTRVDTLYHRHHVDDMPTPERESLKSSPRGTGGPSTIPSWKTSDTSHMSKPQSRTSFSMPSESNTGYGPGRGMPLAVRRRQSRYDPMGRDDEDEDGYEDLGQRHPLRRVAEEDCKEESLTLPGIKALFGVAGEHTSTPPATGSLFASPSLPSLVPNSPSSSPSTARTSRYSSFASNMSSVSEAAPQSGGFTGGWWAPDFERSMSSTSSSPHNATTHRANSFPTAQAFIDEHTDKRRRSDGPPALRDAEESARLRWQAQSRNASYPSTGFQPSPSSTPGGSLRSLLHPPPSSSSMSRQSVSGSSSLSTPLTPFQEHGTPTENPFERRIAPVPSRSSSLVGGQLAQSFADLSASERERRSPLASVDMSASGSTPSTSMAPPMLPSERRGSSYPITPNEPSPHLALPPLTVPRPKSTGPDALRKQSITQPSSPDPHAETRRSSLTEIIMANSGDSIAMANGRYTPTASRASTPSASVAPLLEKNSFSESFLASMQSSGPVITGWPPRRVSTDGPLSTQVTALNSEGGGSGHVGRGRKRSVQMDPGTEMGDHAMRGMEVLAESASARRVSEAAAEEEDSPPKVMAGLAGAGPKYACAFCAKTFSRPSSLRIHTYSHTGERPYVCKEPSCRRRFSVQSNLKRHAKVHQMGGAEQGQAGDPGHHTHSQNRPIERSHRHHMPPHPPGQGFYHPHPQAQRMQHPHPPQQQYQMAPAFAESHRTQGSEGFVGEPRMHPPQQGEEWEDEEEEEEIDELEDDEGEDEAK